MKLCINIYLDFDKQTKLLDQAIEIYCQKKHLNPSSIDKRIRKEMLYVLLEEDRNTIERKSRNFKFENMKIGQIEATLSITFEKINELLTNALNK